MVERYQKQWSQKDIDDVWGKGGSSGDPKWKKDIYGSWMYYPYYGDRGSKYGWEIDHITPKSRGGSDELENLQPLQWENNARKGDD